METTTYTVIKTINDIDSEHIGTITEQCKKVLSLLQKGESFEARKFVKERMRRFTNSTNARNIANMGYRYLRDGKKLGILQEETREVKSISFENFIKLDSVRYWISQLSSTKFKNVKSNMILHGTQATHGYHLWAFNEWLHGKTFRCRARLEIIKNVNSSFFN